MGSGPINGEDPVQKKQGKVTVKYDRKELRKRLVLEEWIIEQLSDLYDCEVSLEVTEQLLGAFCTSFFKIHRQNEEGGHNRNDWFSFNYSLSH